MLNGNCTTERNYGHTYCNCCGKSATKYLAILDPFKMGAGILQCFSCGKELFLKPQSSFHSWNCHLTLFSPTTFFWNSYMCYLFLLCFMLCNAFVHLLYLSYQSLHLVQTHFYSFLVYHLLSVVYDLFFCLLSSYGVLYVLKWFSFGTIRNVRCVRVLAPQHARDVKTAAVGLHLKSVVGTRQLKKRRWLIPLARGKCWNTG